MGAAALTLDGAIRRLRREGRILSAPSFDESGGQLANVYRTAG